MKQKNILLVALIVVAGFLAWKFVFRKDEAAALAPAIDNDDENTFQQLVALQKQYRPNEGWIYKYVKQSLEGTNLNMPSPDWYINGKLTKTSALMEVMSRGGVLNPLPAAQQRNNSTVQLQGDDTFGQKAWPIYNAFVNRQFLKSI